LGRGKRQHVSNSRFKSDEEEYDYHQSQKYIKSKVLLHIFYGFVHFERFYTENILSLLVYNEQ